MIKQPAMIRRSNDARTTTTTFGPAGMPKNAVKPSTATAALTSVQANLDAFRLIHREDGRDELHDLLLVGCIRCNDVTDDQIFH